MKQILASLGVSALLLTAVGCAVESDPAPDVFELPPSVVQQLDPELETIIISPRQWQSRGEHEENLSPVWQIPERRYEPDTIPTETGPAAHKQPLGEIGETTASSDSTDTPPQDPCQCQGAECLSQWVEQNVGCGVCVVFSCGDDQYPHACQACQ